MMRPSTFAAALVLSFSLLACGSSDNGSTGGASATESDAPNSEPSVSSTATVSAQADVVGDSESDDIDPCSLLTVADLEAATTLTWGEAEYSELLSSDEQSVCEWVATSEFAIAQVMVMGTDEWFGENRTSAESVFGLASAPPSIPGADEVYATDEGSLIAMRIAGRFVQVSYIPPGPGNVLAETTDLAEAVADRF